MRGLGAAFAVAVTVLGVAQAAVGGDGKLPPETLRGPAARLDQYPTLGAATTAERARAEALRAAIRQAARGWRPLRAAAASGFPVRRPSRRNGGRGPLWVHAEHDRYQHDLRFLHPDRPETLVYADVPGHPLRLIGVMFAMPRGRRGPTPGGPITRWHTHRVCASGRRRGVTPLADGSCPPGTRSRQGSEMMHVWFTNDLRSTFAIHAPVPELCTARLLPRSTCRHVGHGH